MRKKIMSLLLIVFPILVGAQTEQGDVTLGLSSGLDFDINAYNYNVFLGKSNPYYYYGQNPQYNIGADLGIAITNRMRLRFELKYINIKNAINLDSAEINSNSFTFKDVVVNLSYVGANVRFDYLFLSLNKLEIFVSPAVKFEHLLGWTWTNGPVAQQMDYYGPNYIAGGAVSLLFKYNISNHVAITLTPDYTLFFREFEMNQDGRLYQRFSTNLGLEFKF